VGGSATTSCATCHGTTWKTNCVLCHGGTANQTGAPPKGTWGDGNAFAAGAHTSHIAGSAGIALALDCVACHTRPVDALTAGHVNGSPNVTGYTGTDPAMLKATTDPGWSRATASCATSYCHGATLVGGTNKTPVWTAASGTQATCGACHDNPPASGRHINHTAGFYANSDCAHCHNGIASGMGYSLPITVTLVDKTKHVNGNVDVLFGGRYGGFLVGGYPAGMTLKWDPTARTCSNVSCHRIMPDRGTGPYPW